MTAAEHRLTAQHFDVVLDGDGTDAEGIIADGALTAEALGVDV